MPSNEVAKPFSDTDMNCTFSIYKGILFSRWTTGPFWSLFQTAYNQHGFYLIMLVHLENVRLGPFSEKTCDRKRS